MNTLFTYIKEWDLIIPSSHSLFGFYNTDKGLIKLKHNLLIKKFAIKGSDLKKGDVLWIAEGEGNLTNNVVVFKELLNTQEIELLNTQKKNEYIGVNLLNFNNKEESIELLNNKEKSHHLEMINYKMLHQKDIIPFMKILALYSKRNKLISEEKYEEFCKLISPFYVK